jgi:hypothetical protein
MADLLSFLDTLALEKISKDSKRRLQKHIQGELAFLDRSIAEAGQASCVR